MNDLKERQHHTRIALTAYRADEEPHRIERLQEVAVRCPQLVIGLHDHKGCLSVNWSAPPMTTELIAVIDAWADQGEHDSNHYLRGRLFVEDIGDCPPFEETDE